MKRSSFFKIGRRIDHLSSLFLLELMGKIEKRRVMIVKSAGLLMSLLLVTGVAMADPLAEAMIKLERMQMQWLAHEQAQATEGIQAFTTDGCSGGLSDAWQYMATLMPVFNEHFGYQPPWQSCCVAHDKLYWQGVTERGYKQRLQADNELRSCVEQTGQQHSETLVKKSGRSKQDIEALFSVSAQMMFQAVRAGGKPCSLLPWRWGYGWPQCKLRLN